MVKSKDKGTITKTHFIGFFLKGGGELRIFKSPYAKAAKITSF